MPPIAAALLISTGAFFFLFWGLYELLRAEVPSPLAANAVFYSDGGLAREFYFPGRIRGKLVAGIDRLVTGDGAAWMVETGRRAGRGRCPDESDRCGCVCAAAGDGGGRADVGFQAWPTLAVPLGSLTFLSWLHQTGRDPISSVYTQYWHTSVAMPWQTLGAGLVIFSRTHSTLLAVRNLVALTVSAGSWWRAA